MGRLCQQDLLGQEAHPSCPSNAAGTGDTNLAPSSQKIPREPKRDPAPKKWVQTRPAKVWSLHPCKNLAFIPRPPSHRHGPAPATHTRSRAFPDLRWLQTY